MKVNLINYSSNPTPSYATEGSAGFDLQAHFESKRAICLKSGERKLIHTGLYIQFPKGYELQIRPRSGLALKKGVTVLNAPGTIDSDYRGEIGVILINHSISEVIIQNGDRIAQGVFTQYAKAEFEEVELLEETERGVGGFGHTGRN